MDKPNIIISIIIVVCIAAAVAAYGLTTNNNNIFSDLASMGSDDSGNSGILAKNANTGIKTAKSGTSSGSGSGSSGYGGGSSGGRGSGGTGISQSQAQSIAQNVIKIQGCTAVYRGEADGYYYFTVVDSNGQNVGTISVDKKTGQTSAG